MVIAQIESLDYWIYIILESIGKIQGFKFTIAGVLFRRDCKVVDAVKATSYNWSAINVFVRFHFLTIFGIVFTIRQVFPYAPYARGFFTDTKFSLIA